MWAQSTIFLCKSQAQYPNYEAVSFPSLCVHFVSETAINLDHKLFEPKTLYSKRLTKEPGEKRRSTSPAAAQCSLPLFCGGKFDSIFFIMRWSQIQSKQYYHHQLTIVQNSKNIYRYIRVITAVINPDSSVILKYIISKWAQFWGKSHCLLVLRARSSGKQLWK